MAFAHSIIHTCPEGGTLNYSSPEFLLTGVYTEASDIYSLGHVLLELITNKIPYANSNATIIRTWIETGVKEPIPTHCPQPYQNLIRLCWDMDPSKRPPAGAVVSTLMDFHEENFCL